MSRLHTRCPPRRSRSTKWVPMKPEPPVTSTLNLHLLKDKSHSFTKPFDGVLLQVLGPSGPSHRLSKLRLRHQFRHPLRNLFRRLRLNEISSTTVVHQRLNTSPTRRNHWQAELHCLS